MTITKTSVGKRQTFAERFEAYLETAPGPADVGILVRSFELSLRAANKSPKTIKSYSDTVREFCLFLAEPGMTTDIRPLIREHVEAYVAAQADLYRPRMAQIR